MAMALGNFARQHRAGGAVAIANGKLGAHAPLRFQRGRGARQQGAIQHIGNRMFLRARMARRLGRVSAFGARQKARQIQLARFFCAFALGEPVAAPNQLVEAAHAQLRHQAAHLLGDKEEVIGHMFGRAAKALAQDRVLRGNADRAGVEVAFAHHHAARRNQRRGRQPEAVRTEQRGNQHIAPRAQSAIHLQRDTAAQAGAHERLMRFRQPDFPRAAGMLDGGEWACASAALKARNRDVVGARLGDAGGDRADADFGNEFDRNRGVRIGVLRSKISCAKSSME